MDKLAQLLVDAEDDQQAETELTEMPLAISYRSDWSSNGQHLEAAEFKIELAYGGPSVAIFGDLRNGEPVNPRLMYQDWGTPWTEYKASAREAGDLKSFCDYLSIGCY
jgi:hypothetical protein